MRTLKVSMLFLVCVGIASLMLTMQLSLIRELRDRSYVGPPMNTCHVDARVDARPIDHGSIAPAPERPRATPDACSASALLALPLLLVLLAVLAWSVGTTMARWDCGALAQLPLDAPAPAARPDAVVYLVEGTRGRGDFVVLQHALEDLPQLTPEQLAAAVDAARTDAPGLEHREVAGRWILRQPRIPPPA